MWKKCNQLKVFVTGCSRGLGLAIVRDSLVNGCEVFGCARTESDEVGSLTESFRERFHFFKTDLSKPEFIDDLHRHVPVMDGLDVVVFNAAVGTDGLLASMGSNEIRESVGMNLISPMLLAREAIKGMLLRGGGKLIFISSVAAKHGFRGLSVYSAAKAGLLGFSKTLAREYGSKGIRSNVIMPGFLETEMSSTIGSQQLESVKRRIPVGRLGQAEDVVGMVRFLMSPEADYVNGGEFIIDGGMGS